MKLLIKNIVKTYPNGTRALNHLSLEIGKGMFGLLGPNGAGKSSLMRTIAGLQRPDSGQITLGEIDVLAEPEKVRRSLGYLPQDFGVYPRVSVYDMMDHIALIKGIGNAKQRKETVGYLLDKVNLYGVRHKSLSTFSGGMKQRFGIAQAMLASPKLIIVDEPTAGLDPTERVRFHNLLAEVGQEAIVILSTHIVEDVNNLCSHMAIICRGECLLQGEPKMILAQLDGKVYEKQVTRAALEGYARNHQLISTNLVGGVPQIHVYSEQDPGEGFVAIPVTLEDVYFKTIREKSKVVMF